MTQPIGLYNEGKDTQRHEPYRAGDTIDVKYINLSDLISTDNGNVIGIAEGKLFVGSCQPKTTNGG